MIKSKPLVLSDFKEIRSITDRQCTRLEYKNKKDEHVGFIDYKPKIGQIGMFIIQDKYRNKGLGKQILTKPMNEMRQYDVKEVWASTLGEHPFWANVFNKTFEYRVMVQPAYVKCDGYAKKL